MDCSTPGLLVFINFRSLPKLIFIKSVMPSNYLILGCPLLLLPSNIPSIRVFSDESARPITWPKYWSFSFNISPSNEHPGLIFRMNWLDLCLGITKLIPGPLRWLSGKESACQCRRHQIHRFDPWVGKIPWRRKWQPTPVFLPGESQGRGSLVGCRLWGHTELDMIEVT